MKHGPSERLCPTTTSRRKSVQHACSLVAQERFRRIPGDKVLIAVSLSGPDLRQLGRRFGIVRSDAQPGSVVYSSLFESSE